MLSMVGVVGVVTAIGPVIHLEGLGTARGTSLDNGVDMFLGLPYAAPPLGQLRFAEAAEPLPWSGEHDATRYGAPCLQSPPGDPNEFPDPEAPVPAEDCLFLNVWRGGRSNSSNSSTTALHPVLFFIHGGGFCAGAGSEKWFDGSNLAAGTTEPHVVITVNYRLGPLGFLVSNASGTGGMNGIADQIAALRWVQRHAASIGADKERVTVFGQSAGGMSVCVLSVSPRARGLFARALIESGPCIDPAGWGPGSANAGVASSAAVFAAHNASTLAELRAVTNASTLQWGDADMNDYHFPGYFVDGSVAPTQPSDRYAVYAAGGAGADDVLNPAQMVMGINSRDGTAQYYGEAPYVTNATNGNYTSTTDARWGAQSAAAVRAQYPLEKFNGSAQAAFVAADSDAVLACPTLKIAKALARRRAAATATAVAGTIAPAKGGSIPLASAHVYQLSHYKAGIDVAGELAMVDAKDALHWASHGADLPFVFGHTSGPDLYWNTKISVPFTREEQQLSDTIQSHWTAFSATGKPGFAGSVAWPEFDTSSQAVLDFETATLGGVTELNRFKESECAFWESLPGQLAKAHKKAPRAFFRRHLQPGSGK